MSALPSPSFADACGQQRPFRLAVETAAGDRIAEGELDQPFALIGSDSECEVVLTHPAIPPRLAFLQVVDGNVLVVELAGPTASRLLPDAPLPLGPFTLNLLVPPSDAPTPLGDPLREAADDPRLPAVHLAALGQPETEPTPIRPRLTLLDGACLVLTPAGLFVTDLHGGTRVNGEPIRSARLSAGDELQTGAARYRVRADEPAESREASRVSEALLGGPPDPTDSTADPDDSADALVPLLPLSPPRPAAPFATRLDPELVSLLRQIGGVQCDVLDRLRAELDAMLAGFDTLRRDRLAAFAEQLGHLREVTAQLTREPEPGGVTTLPSQPVDLHAAPPDGDLYDGDAVSEETAAVHQAMFERLASLTGERPGLWRRLRGLLGGRAEQKG